MSIKPYPKYKDSGVEWLGKVPEHWDVVQFKQFVDIQNGMDHKHVEDDVGYPVIGSGGQFTHAKEFLYDGESVLLGRKGTIDKPLFVRGRFWTVDTMYWTKIKPNASGRVAYYLAVSIPFDYYSTSTALPSMTKSAYNGHMVAKPLLSEQSAIASFLDHETSKIDALIAEQEKLIELLKEKRSAVISHAVTTGLNPDVKMKDSGVEWLGMVPEGWRVTKLGRSCKFRSGFAFSAAAFGQDGVVIIRMNNLKRGVLDISDAARIPESACEPAAALSEGDLIWGMSGSTGETGSLGNFARVRLVDLPCQLNQRVGRFDANLSVLDLDFLEYVIQTAYFYEQVMLFVTGTAQFNVSSDQVRSCITALPSLSEQTAIVKFLDTETAKFTTLTTEAQHGIDLLQERRSALISAAVTGQIDVRDFNPSKAA